MRVFKGSRIGRWTAIRPAGVHRFPSGKTQSIWLCRCDCGSEMAIKIGSLTNGNSRSCGCLYLETRNTTHGMSRTSTHRAWRAMVSRCSDSHDKDYRRYGARGIVVCDRWLGDIGPKNFLADMGPRPLGCTIDRIDNDGPYSPDNCRWVTAKMQGRNRHNNRMAELDGEWKCVSEWAEVLGSHRNYLYQWLNSGRSLAEYLDMRSSRDSRKRRNGPCEGSVPAV